MSGQVQQTLASIKNVGSEQELISAVPISRPKINTHMHLPPNFSAFTTPQQAVTLAKEQNVRVVGLSNYYDWTVYGTFGVEAAKNKIFPEFGLEIICLLTDLQKQNIRINDPANPGKFYICGKGLTKFDVFTPEADRILSKIRKADSERMAGMVNQIEKFLVSKGTPTGTTVETVIDGIVARTGVEKKTVYLQERHVALAFQEALFAKIPAENRIARLGEIFGAALKTKGPEDAVGVQNEIRSHLMKVGKPGYVAETFVGFDEAYRLIHELGGFACYPLLVDGNNPMTEFENEPEKLVKELKARNIHAAEFIPNRNSVDVMEKYAKALRAAGIIVTAGTEHNSLDLIGIEPVAKGGAVVPDSLKDIFWEGACVIAAHQYLTLNGKPGYVDGKGAAVDGGGDAKIKKLTLLGAGVIGKYIK